MELVKALPASISFDMDGYEQSYQDAAPCATIRKQNILVMDDVTTSGSTLNEVLRVLQILNEGNDVTVFSLIGRKDLMAETV